MAWLFREWIGVRLFHSVKAEYDAKIAGLQSELRQSEERQRATLAERRGEIEALRSGALSAMTSRQMAVDGKRIEAIDLLWETIVDLRGAKGAAGLLSRLRFDELQKHVPTNPVAYGAFKRMNDDLKPLFAKTKEAERARPYVTDMAWALFIAYTAVASVPMARLWVLELKITDPKILVEGRIAALVREVMPDRAGEIERLGENNLHEILDEMEVRLLAEFHRMMHGTESEAANVEQAARILQLARNAMPAAPSDEGEA